MTDLAVVIPAYNAAATLGAVVRGAREQGLPVVVVVDDGSTDATRAEARRAGARVLAHAGNRGKGAALATAFAALRGEDLAAVITLDADGQHDPRDIPRLRDAFRRTGAGVVIGSRAGAFSTMPPARRLGNRFSCRALALFAGLRLPDSQSGYRLYSTDFLHSLQLRGQAYDAEIEILLLAAAGGVKVESVPVGVPVPDGRSRSHFRPFRDTFRICARVVGFALRRSLRVGR
jgi:glycosyltransferase involved in cell wall biosynthesis